ncbi:MAG: hypothetical protein R3B46_00160 [Phycisphaerales bacterium]
MVRGGTWAQTPAVVFTTECERDKRRKKIGDDEAVVVGAAFNIAASGHDYYSWRSGRSAACGPSFGMWGR